MRSFGEGLLKAYTEVLWLYSNYFLLTKVRSRGLIILSLSKWPSVKQNILHVSVIHLIVTITVFCELI